MRRWLQGVALAGLGLAVGQACARSRRVEPAAAAVPQSFTDERGVDIVTSPAGVLGAEGLQAMQRALVARGYGLSVSGRLDTETQAALRRFQRSQGLAETGLPGIETLAALGVEGRSVFGG